jgi:hypothetical protein
MIFLTIKNKELFNNNNNHITKKQYNNNVLGFRNNK